MERKSKFSGLRARRLLSYESMSVRLLQQTQRHRRAQLRRPNMY